ncbi:uncharacterized protein LOC124861426 isoform X9 [Girardinichthys multiradiatus]|uniref:uncharacterized protein LOC124861426 isoform X9 n=1 Tax=Girardinichthys multiradiatus TaxID=208333 RepID=UPI001FAB8086|nr:uncharacterized protein LOC124861426 isoform X9 [Girardinichthys multiradiatus]
MNSGKKSSSLRNIWSKKLEGSRSSNSGRTQQRKRHQMMDDVFQPRLVLPADVKEEAPEEQSPDVDQQEPEPLQIKEEQEELWTSQEGEQLTVKEETDTRFPLTAAPIKSRRRTPSSLVLHLQFEEHSHHQGLFSPTSTLRLKLIDDMRDNQAGSSASISSASWTR